MAEVIKYRVHGSQTVFVSSEHDSLEDALTQSGTLIEDGYAVQVQTFTVTVEDTEE